MEQSDQTTCVADCLLVPDDLFAGTRACILGFVLVFFAPKLLICLAHGEDKQQGVSRARYEREQLGFVDAEDVMECELIRETELVQTLHFADHVLQRLLILGAVMRGHGRLDVTWDVDANDTDWTYTVRAPLEYVEPDDQPPRTMP